MRDKEKEHSSYANASEEVSPDHVTSHLSLGLLGLDFRAWFDFRFCVLPFGLQSLFLCLFSILVFVFGIIIIALVLVISLVVSLLKFPLNVSCFLLTDTIMHLYLNINTKLLGIN